MIDLDFVRTVNLLKMRFPCSTDSLDRTPSHNLSIGGAKLSLHLEGKAIDLIFDLPQDLIPAAKYAIELGFGGVEVDFRNLHLHLDSRAVPWHVVCTPSKTVTLEEYLTGTSGIV